MIAELCKIPILDFLICKLLFGVEVSKLKCHFKSVLFSLTVNRLTIVFKLLQSLNLSMFFHNNLSFSRKKRLSKWIRDKYFSVDASLHYKSYFLHVKYYIIQILKRWIDFKEHLKSEKHQSYIHVLVWKSFWDHFSIHSRTLLHVRKFTPHDMPVFYYSRVP